MARPKKCRWVCGEPSVNYFKPRVIPMTALEQEQAATNMNASQPTFHRILESAHNKVADALVNGKAIRIEGGDYMVEGARLFKCYDCQNEWQEPHGTGRPGRCPKCNSTNIHRAPSDRGYARRDTRSGGGRRRGQN